MIVIPGEPEPKQENHLLSTELWNRELRRFVERELEFEKVRRVWELRKTAKQAHRHYIGDRMNRCAVCDKDVYEW